MMEKDVIYLMLLELKFMFQAVFICFSASANLEGLFNNDFIYWIKSKAAYLPDSSRR